MSKNTSFRVHNDASQSERRSVIDNDRRAGGTYHEIAAAEATAIGGRWAVEARTRVTGAMPVPQYPALPATSPWRDDPVPAEPSLGEDLSAAPVVGEYHEIAASLAASQGGGGIDHPTLLPGDSPGGGEASLGGTLPADVSSRRRRSSKQRRG